MTVQLEPIAQVSQRATEALLKELGVVDTIRFLGQFRAGTGDYTAQRHKLTESLSVHEIAGLIKGQRGG